MVTCSNCGYEIERCPQCGQEMRRHNKRGVGAHYAYKIKQLNSGHTLALESLEELKAYSFATGATLPQVWVKAKEICERRGEKWPKMQGLSGRLSELQGLGRVKSERNVVKLLDERSQRWTSEHPQRWYLLQVPKPVSSSMPASLSEAFWGP